MHPTTWQSVCLRALRSVIPLVNFMWRNMVIVMPWCVTIGLERFKVGDGVAFSHSRNWSSSSEEDIIVHQDKENPDWVYGAGTSEDGKYIYLYIYKDTAKARLQILLPDFTNLHTVTTSKISCGLESLIRMGSSPKFPGKKSLMNLRRITTCETLSRFRIPFWPEWYSITNHGSLIYVKTNLNAPRYKVITIDLSTGEPEICDFIPELEDATLAQVKCVNKEYFVVIYKRNVIVSLAIIFENFLTSTGQRWNIPLL